MSDQKQEPTSISQQPDAEDKKKSTELSEQELEKVTGGQSELTITKYTDAASPKLY